MSRLEASRPPSVSVLTPIGRGAVGTICIQTDSDSLEHLAGAMFRAANGQPLSQQSIGKIVFGRWGGPLDQPEDVVVCRTHNQTCEIHCHGGDAAVRRIVADLQQAGCQALTWQQQLTESDGVLEAECQDALSRATTWRTAEILYEQSAGLLRTAFVRLRQLSLQQESQAELMVNLDALLQRARFGQHLSDPWSIVLTGRPNVGKSSLINALLGYQRAIVFDQPGTTRDVVTGETAFEGWPVVLADTAGLRETSDELEAAGIALARQRLESADSRLVLLDVSEPPTDFDERLLHEWPDAIVVGHKCDRMDAWGNRLPAQAIRVSSVTGQGLDELQSALVRQLVPNVPSTGTPIPVTARQIDLLNAARNAAESANWERTQELIAELIAG